jgi:uncharacterized protein (TIGR00369 family)
LLLDRFLKLYYHLPRANWFLLYGKSAMPKSIFDTLANKPPAAELMGWDLLNFDKERKWVKIAFTGRPEFTNPTGFIQGGILVAMLDELMGSAIIVTTEGASLSTTISINVDFIRPGPVGQLIGEGSVTNLGKSIAFVEGKLFDPKGVLLARATASCKLIPMNPEWTGGKGEPGSGKS